MNLITIREKGKNLIVTVALVTDRVDRFNTVIEPSGCNTDFRNVVIDYNHNKINTGAKLTNKRIEDITLDTGDKVKALVGDIIVSRDNEVHDEEGEPKAKLYDWLKQGRIFSVSVDFDALEVYEKVQDNFVRFVKWTLKKLSFLDTVPGQEDSFILNIQERSGKHSQKLPSKQIILNINKDNMAKNKKRSEEQAEVQTEEVVDESAVSDKQVDGAEVIEVENKEEVVDEQTEAGQEDEKESEEKSEKKDEEVVDDKENEKEREEDEAKVDSVKEENEEDKRALTPEEASKFADAIDAMTSILEIVADDSNTSALIENIIGLITHVGEMLQGRACGKPIKENEQRTGKERAEWTTAFINELPDSSFVVIEPAYVDGGTEDKRARHLPVRDQNGTVDLPHLRNAVARRNQIKPVTNSISQTDLRRLANENLMKIIESENLEETFASLFGEERKMLKQENKKLKTMLRKLQNSPSVGKLDSSVVLDGVKDEDVEKASPLEEERRRIIGEEVI